jgi:hypothetical protein
VRVRPRRARGDLAYVIPGDGLGAATARKGAHGVTGSSKGSGVTLVIYRDKQ